MVFMNNAYILERTMNEYEELKDGLLQAGFEIEKEKDDEDIMVTVEHNRIKDFAHVVQKHLNEPFNYIDIKFPEQKLSVIVFKDRVYRIDNAKQNVEAKQWAVSIGLPENEADWPIFF